MNTEWIQVVSSNVHSYRYDPATQDLDMRFLSSVDRKFYRYAKVPLEVFEALEAAPSKGVFHAAQIKNVYACTPMLLEVLEPAPVPSSPIQEQTAV